MIISFIKINEDIMVSKCNTYMLKRDASGFIYCHEWFYADKLKNEANNFWCTIGNRGYDYAFTFKDAIIKLIKLQNN